MNTVFYFFNYTFDQLHGGLDQSLDRDTIEKKYRGLDQ